MGKTLAKSQFRTTLGYDHPDSKKYPIVSGKDVVVSFKVKDCNSTYINTLDESQINLVVNLINSSYEDLSLQEKTEVLLKADLTAYNLPLNNRYFKPLSNNDIKYFKLLILNLACLTGLKFKMAEEGLSEDTSIYSASICGTKNYLVTRALNCAAYSNLAVGERQCLIMVDDDIYKSHHNALKLDRENTLGHEFLHCLGLNHPKYKSMQENKNHRSMMEDKSPIVLDCGKKNSDMISEIKCRNLPNMPTDVDVLTLIDLYGQSANNSQVCKDIRENFIKQYPSMQIESIGTINGQTHDEL